MVGLVMHVHIVLCYGAKLLLMDYEHSTVNVPGNFPMQQKLLCPYTAKRLSELDEVGCMFMPSYVHKQCSSCR